MPTYRLIEKSAGTGERITQLNHLGFRVWMQYQLSADDFGVCPAEAVKLQGENLALQREPVKRVQEQIDQLVTIGLCGTFTDGSRRYLFQFDWQDYQKIKHPSKTPLPPIPNEMLEKCSPATQALFRDHSSQRNGSFRPHGNATANATALASATADRFERFWKAYPRKVAKGGAQAIWRRLNPSEELTAQMIRAVERQAGSDQWSKDGGKFIPHPTTWLNQGRWQDEPDNHGPSDGGQFDGLREFVRHG